MSRKTMNDVSIENSGGAFIKSKDSPVINRDEDQYLSCLECNVDFVDRYSLNQHLLFHIKQPIVILTPLKTPSIKITLKSTSKDSFEVVSSPVSSPLTSPTHCAKLAEQEQEQHDEATESDNTQDAEEANISSSPNYMNGVESPAVNSENSNSSSMNALEAEDEQMTQAVEGDEEDYSNVPGAEPTPPPEPSPEYPKIRIKTTGLLRESLTITEITDENPGGEPTRPEIIELGSKDDAAQGSSGFGTSHCDEGNLWTTSSLEDPLRIPESSEKDDGNLLSLFSDNNERVKDLGFTSSESEFISLDRLDDRNRTAMQVYNSSIVTPTSNQNPLNTLTGLPMQQLAQQVSRLQPNSGMHQQNVLINIQQFPQPPPPQGPTHGYQPPPMYHHPPQPTMYQPYQYQPPNPMYYPAPGYPHHMPPPPPPQMSQAPPQQQMPNQQQMQPPVQQQFRPPMGQRPTAPVMRQQAPGTRPQMQRQPMPRQPGQLRQRAIAPRPRAPMTNIRGPRPRMPMPNSAHQAQHPQQQRMVKRTAEQIQALQKRKRVDVLLPDKNEDPDCQVVCMQPKNTGLPQIQSVQGATQDPSDGNVMHLSDSITLSVRNQPVKPNSPKKSDAKAVANILATRGITVTATAKAKEKTEASSKGSPPPPPVAINLNSAVSIIPAAKTGNTKQTTQQSDSKLPTVDLTDDTASEHHPPPPSKPAQQIQRPIQRRGLPYKCDLCAAQYPTMLELNKHKQGYHKTNGSCEIGVPLIDLKMPGVVQKLSSLGIFNYIPLPGAGSQGMFGIPVINARNAANASVIGASSILTLGPIRTIQRTPQNPNVNKTHPGTK